MTKHAQPAHAHAHPATKAAAAGLPVEVPMDATLIASVCHEANRAYCLAQGDTTQLPWTDAPDWQRQSAVNGVNGILAGTITKPQDSHESWLKEKQEAGWVYGPVKDADAKPPTHPCCVPYADLPAAQQRKDTLFFAVVQALRR